jgi:RNA polymerase sigma factor (sigma-70 family)
MLVWAEMADRDLVQRAVSPSSPREREQALQAIYDRHSADVLGLCGWWLSDPDAALDAAQSTFEAAIKDLTSADGPTLREPAKLGAWLHGIAKNQCRAVWRQRNREGEFPEEDLEDAEHEVTASRRRQAQVDRMLDIVAATFTQRQQTIFRLVLPQGIRGQALATELGVSEREANDATYENQALVLDGFGAYVLARDGRAYCEGLAHILDEAAWDGQTFTRVLRLRILRHLDKCKICDYCTTCNVQKKKLIRPYAPVLIPLLMAATLRDRIYQLIRSISTPGGSADGGQGGPGATATAGDDAAAGTETHTLLDDYISQDKPPSDPRHMARRGRRKAAPEPGNQRRGRISAKLLAVGQPWSWRPWSPWCSCCSRGLQGRRAFRSPLPPRSRQRPVTPMFNISAAQTRAPRLAARPSARQAGRSSGCTPGSSRSPPRRLRPDRSPCSRQARRQRTHSGSPRPWLPNTRSSCSRTAPRPNRWLARPPPRSTSWPSRNEWVFPPAPAARPAT